jgi:hypothetical protein
MIFGQHFPVCGWQNYPSKGNGVERSLLVGPYPYRQWMFSHKRLIKVKESTWKKVAEIAMKTSSCAQWNFL